MRRPCRPLRRPCTWPVRWAIGKNKASCSGSGRSPRRNWASANSPWRGGKRRLRSARSGATRRRPSSPRSCRSRVPTRRPAGSSRRRAMGRTRPRPPLLRASPRRPNPGKGLSCCAWPCRAASRWGDLQARGSSLRPCRYCSSAFMPAPPASTIRECAAVCEAASPRPRPGSPTRTAPWANGRGEACSAAIAPGDKWVQSHSLPAWGGYP
jgi:hypothetical protein